MITHRTDRLLLREAELADAPFLMELMNQPDWLEYIGDRQIYSVEAAEEYVTLRVEHPLLGGPFTLELAGPPDVPGRVRVWLDAVDPALVVRFLAPARCAALGALAALGRVKVQAGALEVELPGPDVASLPTDVVGRLVGVLVSPWPQLAFRTEPPGKARDREDPIPPEMPSPDGPPPEIMPPPTPHPGGPPGPVA